MVTNDTSLNPSSNTTDTSKQSRPSLRKTLRHLGSRISSAVKDLFNDDGLGMLQEGESYLIMERRDGLYMYERRYK